MPPVLVERVGVIQVTEGERTHEQMLAMNEALTLGALRQHELTEAAESLNIQLQKEIAERKLAEAALRESEDRQRLLTNELAHRGKNLLAVIQSIASRSLSGTRTLAEARDVLVNRIQALAQSQTALLDEGFQGALIAEIIRLEFKGFSERVKAVGPKLMLNSGVTQMFALVMHELATNAVKYGALSQPDGHVAIHWSIDGAGAEARFKFRWQERNGPPVTPPSRQGFGSTILEKAAAQDFGAPPVIRFAPEGLIYEIDTPLSVVAAGLTVSPTLLGSPTGVIE